MLYGGKKGGTEGMLSNCDCCANYVYDEEDDCCYCDINLDEDDYYRLVSSSYKNCPYYQSNDEYKIVRRQM